MNSEPKPKSIHAGHRARMREKLAKLGTEHFADHEILEMLLFYVIPRGDTNAIAHELLERFKGFRGVFEAKPEELRRISGFGEHSAALFSLIREVARRYFVSRYAKRLQLTTTQSIGTFIAPLFIGHRDEQIYLLCLDAKKQPVYGGFIRSGSRASAELDFSVVVATAVSVHAKFVVIAHNHPSGYAVPSEADISATLRLKRALKEVGIALLDHLVIADPTDPAEPVGDYISLADSRLI